MAMVRVLMTGYTSAHVARRYKILRKIAELNTCLSDKKRKGWEDVWFGRWGQVLATSGFYPWRTKNISVDADVLRRRINRELKVAGLECRVVHVMHLTRIRGSRIGDSRLYLAVPKKKVVR